MKINEYLPLSFCKGAIKYARSYLGNDVMKLLGNEDAVKENLFFLNCNTFDYIEIIKEIMQEDGGLKLFSEHCSNILLRKFAEAMIDDDSRYHKTQEMHSQCLGIIPVLKWAKNKQCFKFDGDFLNELMRAESIPFSENSWDYLPYNTMYIDISETELSERLKGIEGFFIDITKLTYDDLRKMKLKEYVKNHQYGNGAYFNRVRLIGKEHSINTEFTMPNKTQDDIVSAYTYSTRTSEDLSSEEKELADELHNFFLYGIPQILNYLASVEPDVQESEMTKHTYRKPPAQSVPQNKFSEVKVNDVGVKFGISYRKWKNNKTDSDSERTYTASGKPRKSVRPHSRRAHWSHFWYNGEDGEKVRRPKWIMQTFVGTNKEDEDSDNVTIYEI